MARHTESEIIEPTNQQADQTPSQTLSRIIPRPLSRIIGVAAVVSLLSVTFGPTSVHFTEDNGFRFRTLPTADWARDNCIDGQLAGTVVFQMDKISLEEYYLQGLERIPSPNAFGPLIAQRRFTLESIPMINISDQLFSIEEANNICKGGVVQIADPYIIN